MRIVFVARGKMNAAAEQRRHKPCKQVSSTDRRRAKAFHSFMHGEQAKLGDHSETKTQGS
jgi:hypothetical protein